MNVWPGTTLVDAIRSLRTVDASPYDSGADFFADLERLRALERGGSDGDLGVELHRFGIWFIRVRLICWTCERVIAVLRRLVLLTVLVAFAWLVIGWIHARGAPAHRVPMTSLTHRSASHPEDVGSRSR